MSAAAKQGIEDAIASAMNADAGLRALLKVPILPGRAAGDRPEEYIAIIADQADSRSAMGNVWKVIVNVISVSAGDEAGRAASKARFAAVVGWFTSGECPIRSYEDDVLKVYGYALGGQSDARKDRSYGDVLSMAIGCWVK